MNGDAVGFTVRLALKRRFERQMNGAAVCFAVGL
jgi:hypothetical protein